MKIREIIPFIWQHKWYIAAGAVILAAVFFGAESCSDRRAASKYQKQIEETLKKSAEAEARAAMHEKNEAVLAEKNAALKATNEAQAKLLTDHGSKELTKGAENLAKIQKEKEAAIDRIAATPDNEQGCELCKDARRAGITLKMCEGVCG